MDTILENALSFEIVDGVLFRRVYDSVEGEVQLRCCVPDVATARFEQAGQGGKPLNYRDLLLLEYHNGKLAGHVGRERTTEMIERDFWWPGLREDVRRWCKRCQHCLGERGTTGVSAWTRTELFSRPFRVIQYDTITCKARVDGGSNYVLTVIDCFSRWVWLIPIVERNAKTVAGSLMVKVFLGLAGFPVVLRSDNAKEFVSEVAEELNKLLSIRHVTGSAYHPQSQGIVESMHKTLNGLVRGLVQEHPETWESRIPYAEFILRIVPLKALGGRCAYEVVLGLKPKLPRALDPALFVEHVTVSEYIAKIQEYFKTTFADVDRAQTAAGEAAAEDAPGHLSKEFVVGDLVIVRREPTVNREGPLRFQPRTYPDVYRVSKKLGKNTFTVRSLTDPTEETVFMQPLHADRLVKIDMPELDLDPNQLRRLEVHQPNTDLWKEFVVERFASDGRVLLRVSSNPSETIWVDLSTKRYRWVA